MGMGLYLHLLSRSQRGKERSFLLSALKYHDLFNVVLQDSAINSDIKILIIAFGLCTIYILDSSEDGL